jgi:hypothetical protein
VPPPAAQNQSVFNLSFTFQPKTATVGVGNYDTVNGASDVSTGAGKPVLPVQITRLNTGDNIARGVLWLGGTWNDTTNFVPMISQIVTDQIYSTVRPTFPFGQFFPPLPASVNRLLTVDGTVQQRLVVVPAQFQADVSSGTPTTGLMRRYNSLELEVLSSPKADPDFTGPVINSAVVISSPTQLSFEVRTSDDSLMVTRVVVLYAGMNDTAWRRAELTWDAGTGIASGSVTPLGGRIFYIVQAVDGSGNVSAALDHNNPFVADTPLAAEARFFTPASLNAGAPIVLSLAQAANDTAPAQFAFDCGNGSFGAPSAASSITCSSANVSSPLTVRGQIITQTAQTFTATVVISAVAPSAAFVASSPVVAGQSFSLALNNAGGPSSSSFSYAFDCGTGYGGFGAANTATCSTGAAGALTVRGTVRDGNSLETEYSAIVSVIAAAPQATTTAATNVGIFGATLNGSANPNNSNTSVTFEWGAQSGVYTQTAPASPIGVNGGATVPVSATLSGLLPNQTYFYRVKAVSAGGVALGTEQRFTTLSSPFVTTTLATNVTVTQATLNGVVLANGAPASVSFQWGTTSTLPFTRSVAATPATVNGFAQTMVSATLTGLSPFTRYFFRVAATNTLTSAVGATLSFTTPFNFAGFFQPVDNLPVMNVVNAGRSVPVKFSLNGNYGLNILRGMPQVQVISCSANVPADEVTETTTSNSGLQYDAATNQYTFVWKTERAWAGTCRQLILNLIDGTMYRANFRFR